MKQTSSALTFLMAQYRAIFKRAYVKGIAAAVLLTAGLATGASQVQAADLTTNWKDGSAITTQGSGDTFKRTEQSTASSLTVGVGHSLETSGGIFVNSDADIRGDLTISSGAIQLIEKEGDKKDKDVYRHAFNATGADLNLSGNIGAASFNISDGSLVLTSGGVDNTNLTAYGKGWVQGSGEVDGIDYDRTTANGLLSNMDITVNAGANVAALNQLTINNGSEILMSGSGASTGVSGDDTAYLEGSRHLDISDSTINVSGYANGIFSPEGRITNTTITVSKSAKLLVTGNANNYTNVLSGTDSGSKATYTLTGTTLTNSGTVHLDTAVLNLNDDTVLTNSGTMILGRTGADNVVNLNDGAAIKIDGKADGHIYAQSDINMSGGEISLVTTDGQFGLIGVSKPDDYNAGTLGTFDTDLKATGGKITITKSQIQMNNITLAGDVEVTIGSHIGDKHSYWTDNALINAEDNEDGKTGVLTIDGATITMNAGSSIMGREVNLNSGEISLNGTDDAYASGESGSAMFMAYGTSGVMNLAGGSIEIDAAAEHGAIRAKDVNLTGTTITNAGTLTIAGVLDKTVSGANAVASDGGILFDMTGGTLTNNTNATLNLGVFSGTAVNNSGSVFTIAGGNFTNAGTVNVTSGSELAFTGTTTVAPVVKNTGTISVASGAHFTTDGTVTIGSTTDAGTIKFTGTGSSGTFAGENVVLNNKIDIATGSTVQVAGNVTFNGDNSATNKVDLTGSGTLTLNTGSTLTINDAANTLGLTYTVADGSGSFTKGSGAATISGSDASATLYLDVTGMTGLAGQSFDATELANLKTSLTSAIGSGSQYTVNFQGISIDLASGTISSGNTTDYSKVEDFLISGVETDELKNTSVAVTGSTEVQGSVGQVTTDGTNVIVADKTLTLNGHATTVGGEVASPVLTQTGTGTDATVAGVTLGQGSVINAQVAGSGVVGAITTENGKGSVVVGANTDLSVVKTGTAVSAVTAETPSLTYDNIGTAGSKVYSVQVDGALTANEIHTNSLTASGAVEAQDDVVADSAQVTGSLNAATLTTQNATVAGTVNVTGTINAKVTGTDAGTGVFAVEDTGSVVANKLEADTATLQGTTQVAEVSAISAKFDGGSHTITKSLDVTGDKKTLVVTNGATLSSAVEGETSSTLAIDAGTGGIRVDGNASVTANEITTAGNVYVGADVTSESAGSTAGAGSLAVNSLNLNGNSLIVDPAFGSKFSFVGVGSFSNNQQEVDAGVLNGNAYALQNAILAIGETDEAAVSELFAQYINSETQSLSADNVGSIVYIAEQLDVATGNKLVADSTASVGADGTFDSTKYGQNDVYIGDHSVLAISVKAASNADAAIKFADSGAQITASTTGKVVITGDYNSVDSLKLFADAGTAGTGNGTDVEIVGTNGLRVETLNGLMYKTYKQGEGIGSLGIEEMSVNQDKVASAYTDASSSVRNSILSYVTGDTQWYNTKAHDINETRIHGARVDDVTTDGAGNYYWRNENGTQGNALTDEQKANLTFVKVTVDVPADEPATRVPQTEYVVYEKANNRFLTAVREQVETTGSAAESAARMADFAGVAQVALKAGAATTDAIAGRMGMGAQNSAITFANNGQGAGIWVTPIYVSSDSDGFEAQGVDYGTDINLYGVALGGDYTLANGVRIGAMFNVGSGDADGQGAGSSVTSDFDYYGFGLYAGYSVGQFSIVGDVSYTAVDNDVEANTGIDKLETSLDSANLSIGVTGSYAFETAAGVTVTPHVGLRYSNIDIDDYSVKGKTYGTVGDYSADSLSVFSIPVGVTIASEFQAGTWSVKPSFDVTLTGNFGDDEAEGTFHWAGVENIDSSLNSEIFDNFTYGASLGIAAQSSSGISLGVAVGYTGSSNVDDFGVNANARFTF